VLRWAPTTNENSLDLSAIAAGLVAYGLSVVASVVLVFLTYRLN
jgi:DNA-binding IclR family transcriptional regulator